MKKKLTQISYVTHKQWPSNSSSRQARINIRNRESDWEDIILSAWNDRHSLPTQKKNKKENLEIDISHWHTLIEYYMDAEIDEINEFENILQSRAKTSDYTVYTRLAVYMIN